MAERSHTRTIAAAPSAIWEVLADFGSLGTWADTVDHSCLLNGDHHAGPVGLTRRVQTGRDTFVETIATFEEPRVLAYDIVGVPRGLVASNRWNLDPGPAGRTTVTLTSTVCTNSAVPRPLRERVVAWSMAKRSEALLSSLALAMGGAR